MKPAKIRYLLDIKNTTQNEIAKVAEVEPSLVSRVINGSKTSKRVAKAISSAVGKPLDEVFPRYSKEAA